ncbi:MAG: alanyl-tRNA editing protein [Desulfurococcales archaeon]|nr:alanyl-tRNA editing protein [Desulfurococcales archaeon]
MDGTRLLFQEDSYLREFEARVVSVEGDRVVLDRTAFHPRPSGGLDADRGVLEGPLGVYKVVDTVAEGDVVVHIVPGHRLNPGDRVVGRIDWDRRYRMMKLHTASHILAAILYKRYGALVTGGHISPEQARDDFDLSMVEGDWKEVLRRALEEAEEVAGRCLEVKIYWLPRDEALKIPGLVKLAEKTPPGTNRLRIVEIPGVDVQADGGPHVRNTCEIGGLKLLRLESKGRKRRRIYYTLSQ